jgi:uncharacterized protein YuzE
MEEMTTLFYDREGDVLYITIGEPRPAISRELDNDVLLRVEPNTGKIVGMTVLNFASRFSDLEKEHPLPVHMALSV